MSTTSFRVFALFNEISLNKVASHFGIRKKFEWEDFLRLSVPQLKGILKEPEGKLVDIFPFGSIVFINLQHHEIVDIVNYLMTVDSTLVHPNYNYADDYKLELTEEDEAVDYDAMWVHELAGYQTGILSVVLAKSVALEKVEADIEELLDEIEPIIDRLQHGKLSARDDAVAKIASRILRFKYSTVSYIMLLDKPDITWNDSDAESMYSNLSRLFELDERYDKLQAKSSTLMDILQMFTSLVQHRKSNSLEWMIIILIVIEIVISLVDFFLFKLK